MRHCFSQTQNDNLFVLFLCLTAPRSKLEKVFISHFFNHFPSSKSGCVLVIRKLLIKSTIHLILKKQAEDLLSLHSYLNSNIILIFDLLTVCFNEFQIGILFETPHLKQTIAKLHMQTLHGYFPLNLFYPSVAITK